MREHIIHPIPPFYEERSTILILGSFPSVKSREQMFFYGHPQNRFWKVIAQVYEDAVPYTVSEKKAFLTKHRIALWDVIGACDIEGSSDASIENVTANDLSAILDTADVRGIFVNGKTAEKYYVKYAEKETRRKAVCLPSTSPANAAWNAEKLSEAWSAEIRSCLRPEDFISELFDKTGLGHPQLPMDPVSGGFMHRMYRVCADRKTYAVKLLNPVVMRRPDALKNYQRAESLEQVLEKNKIPIAAALTFHGCKMQKVMGEYFYIFPWQDGRVTDWDHITCEQCEKAGQLQGRIHSIEEKRRKVKPSLSHIDWDAYIETAEQINTGIGELLKNNRALLEYAQNEVNKARRNLPDIECITDEDMDPKNVMWNEGKPVIIDLECLDRGNPVSSALQLSLQWAGVTRCSVDAEKIRAFFDGYLENYDNGFRDYAGVFGLAYTWIEWLEYNITRALGQCIDRKEQQMGAEEAVNTISRIRYIHDMESEIKEALTCWGRS